MTSSDTGRKAEALAERWLTERGLRTLSRNYRCRQGELDLVMADDGEDLVVIVEVRYRRNATFGTPEQTVTAGKQRRIVSAARRFLAQHPQAGRAAGVRFDVLALQGSLESPAVRWLRGAFGAA